MRKFSNKTQDDIQLLLDISRNLELIAESVRSMTVKNDEDRIRRMLIIGTCMESNKKIEKLIN